MNKQITVAVANIGQLERAVASLRHAARRLELDPEPRLDIDWKTRREVQQTTIAERREGGGVTEEERKRVVTVVDCCLILPEQSEPVEKAWRVMGVVEPLAEHNDEGGVVELKAPTNEIYARPVDVPRLSAYRHAEQCCEHCHANRRRRKTLVLEEKDTGRMKQVGKECAIFYVGEAVEKAVRTFEFTDTARKVLRLDQEQFWQSGGTDLVAWDGAMLMSHAFASIRKHGWVPRYRDGDGQKDATVWRVRDRLQPETPRWTTGDYAILEEDVEKGHAAVNWLAGLKFTDAERDDPRNYLASLQSAYEPGWISEKRLTFAIGLARAYDRHLEDMARRPSRKVGEVGQRSMMAVKLVGKQFYANTEFGTMLVVRLEDVNGNRLNWRTNPNNIHSAPFRGPGTGKWYGIKATIKEHKPYREHVETALNRLEVLTDPNGLDHAPAVEEFSGRKPKREQRSAGEVEIQQTEAQFGAAVAV